MAYTNNEKSTGLDLLTDLTITQSDLHIVGDVSDSGRAKAITQNLLEDYIANSTNFVDELVANNYFTTELANDSNFVNELTTNTTFQTAVNNFVTTTGGSGGGSSSKPMTFSLISSDSTPAPYQGYIDREAQLYVSGTTFTLQDPTGNTQSRLITTDWADADVVSEGYVLLGQYLYVLLTDTAGSTATRLYRYTASDLSLGGTLMTISGQAFGTTAAFTMTSNGTDFFFSNDAGGNAGKHLVAKYTLSGTTLTYVATTTCGATSAIFTSFAVDTLGNYIGTDGGIIYTYNTSGTLTSTSGQTFATLGHLLNWTNTIYGSDSNSSLYTKLYIDGTDDTLGISGTTIQSVANENLTAGQTVGISSLGGGIARALRGKTTFSLADTGASAKYVPLGSDRVFILYKVDGAATLKGVVGTIDRDTMTIAIGTAVQYTTTLAGTYDVCLLDTDKVGVMYAESGAPKDVKIHVSTIATATITANAQQAFVTLTNNLSALLVTKVATDKAVVFTSEASVLNPLVTAFTVSGTTLGTVGTGVTSIEASKIVSHTTDAFSLFGNVAAVAEDSIQIGTVSTVAITLGTSVTVSTFQASAGSSGLCVVDSTHIAFAYGTAGSNSAVRCASISGTTPTLGTQLLTGLNGGGAIEYDANGTRLIYKSFSQAYTLSGTTLTLQCTISGTGYTSGTYIYMGTYYAAISISNSANEITIEGMCGSSLPGIVTQTVSRTGTATVLTKGSSANQTGLIAGQKYIANGTGGLILDSNGNFIALNTTTITV